MTAPRIAPCLTAERAGAVIGLPAEAARDQALRRLPDCRFLKQALVAKEHTLTQNNTFCGRPVFETIAVRKLVVVRV
jgi:hypothetical protein